jgi:hypothetical protein
MSQNSKHFLLAAGIIIANKAIHKRSMDASWRNTVTTNVVRQISFASEYVIATTDALLIE